MTRRVLITGSRNWTDRGVIAAALAEEAEAFGRDMVVVHGAARGADRVASWAARDLGVATEEHPADWERHGKAAGPLRNQQMVDAGADVCLAFPLPASRGTRDCMRRAEAAGIPVIVHAPKETR